MSATATADKAYYTYADLQERWGVSRQTIWREIKQGRLTTCRVRGSVRFSRAAVQGYERKMGR
jgi:excisionase family DNA binding protein